MHANILSRDIYNNSNIWIAPEECQSIRDNIIGKQADMWRLGVLLYYLITGKEPEINNNYNTNNNNINTSTNNNNLNHTISQGFSLSNSTTTTTNEPFFVLNDPIFDNLPYYHSLISLLLHSDPNQRITTETLMDHPVFWINTPSRIIRFVSRCLKYLKSSQGNDNFNMIFNNISTSEWFGSNSWKSSLPADIYECIPKYETYKGDSVTDLLHAIMVALTQTSRIPEGDSKQQLKKRALVVFQDAGHPATYFHNLYPLLFLRLWTVLFTNYQSSQDTLNQYEQVLGF